MAEAQDVIKVPSPALPPKRRLSEIEEMVAISGELFPKPEEIRSHKRFCPCPACMVWNGLACPYCGDRPADGVKVCEKTDMSPLGYSCGVCSRAW